MKVIVFEMAPKINQKIWATFAIKFVTKKFKKLPNPVTLIAAFEPRHFNQDNCFERTLRC